jgi:hypothetical protein
LIGTATRRAESVIDRQRSLEARRRRVSFARIDHLSLIVESRPVSPAAVDDIRDSSCRSRRWECQSGGCGRRCRGERRRRCIQGLACQRPRRHRGPPSQSSTALPPRSSPPKLPFASAAYGHPGHSSLPSDHCGFKTCRSTGESGSKPGLWYAARASRRGVSPARRRLERRCACSAVSVPGRGAGTPRYLRLAALGSRCPRVRGRRCGPCRSARTPAQLSDFARCSRPGLAGNKAS